VSEVTPEGTVYLQTPTGKTEVKPFVEISGEQAAISTLAAVEEAEAVPEPTPKTAVTRNR
jgi:hypothetical protein